jgi:cytosine/adenosine deaminase-related metal-dependent hydrolase
MPLTIAGRIVPLDRQDPDAVFKGRVHLDNSGAIESITTANAPMPSGFGNAPTLDVGDAFVLPGLIDLHNHIGYNTLPLWVEPTQKEAFRHHNSWTGEPSYRPSVSWPANALVQAEPEAVLAHVQLRALVGGTTAIQGWPIANRKHTQVVRDVDSETAGTNDRNLIFTSALTKQPLELGKIAQAQKQRGAGFIYHCAEGQVGSIVVREFVDVANAGCLEKTFIGIHCCAMTGADWQRWPKSKAGAVVWSPFSNLWLYGMTTDVAAARAQDVSVCLGSDWGPSGTKNVQGEMKVAKLVSDDVGLGLTDRELVAMVTTNPGDALSRCWRKIVGRLQPDAFADITVFRSRSGNVWKDVAASTEDDVMLVVCGGVPRYGDAALMSAAALTESSPLTVRGRKRAFAIPDPSDPTKAWSLKDITGRLDAVRDDPVKALKNAEGRRRAFAGQMDDADAPLILVLDMPGGDIPIAGDVSKFADQIVIPPLPSLVHDAAFFKSIKGRGFHGGLLDGLAELYS